MTSPDSNFRPNPNRAVYCFGTVDQTMVSAVVPQILKYRYDDPETPITVYINSLGGNVDNLEAIVTALRSPDPDGKKCRWIAVVLGEARSAAATLLTLADYSFANRDSIIHFHGTRLRDEELTVERASLISSHLATRNSKIAMRLASAVVPRLINVYSSVKQDFDDLKKSSPELSEVECFIHCVLKQCSGAREIIQLCMSQLASAQLFSKQVLGKVQDKTNGKSSGKSKVKNFDAEVLKKLIDFEDKQRGGILLDESGVEVLTEDFLLLRDFEIGEHRKEHKRIITTFFLDLIQKDELETLGKTKNLEKGEIPQSIFQSMVERVRAFWYFTVLLYRQLQKGENILTASEAYWIGAVDEVLGSSLRGIRAKVEYIEGAGSEKPTETASGS